MKEMEKSSFLTFWRWWMFCPVIPVCLFVCCCCVHICVCVKDAKLDRRTFFFSFLKKMRAKKMYLFEVSISKRRRAFLFSFSGDFCFLAGMTQVVRRWQRERDIIHLRFSMMSVGYNKLAERDRNDNKSWVVFPKIRRNFCSLFRTVVVVEFGSSFSFPPRCSITFTLKERRNWRERKGERQMTGKIDRSIGEKETEREKERIMNRKKESKKV